MWNKIIEKLFCNHKWESHSKNSWNNGEFSNGRIERFSEVLICKECGKIKQIVY